MMNLTQSASFPFLTLVASAVVTLLASSCVALPNALPEAATAVAPSTVNDLNGVSQLLGREEILQRRDPICITRQDMQAVQYGDCMRATTYISSSSANVDLTSLLQQPSIVVGDCLIRFTDLGPSLPALRGSWADVKSMALDIINHCISVDNHGRGGIDIYNGRLIVSVSDFVSHAEDMARLTKIINPVGSARLTS